MRQLNFVGRGVLAVAVVMMLATPVQARTNEETVWSGPVREQIAKLVKIAKKVKGVVRTFGDGLSDPKP